MNQVISITADFDRLEWRLRGPNATVGIPEEDRISGQHTAAEVASGRVVMFDNGLERGQPFSRAAEFDVTGSEARMVWEFRPQYLMENELPEVPAQFQAFVSRTEVDVSQSDIRAFVRGELGVIRGQAARQLGRQHDTATAYHLRDGVARIDAILDVED